MGCQAWNSQEPHSHSRTPENYPDSGLMGNNCRNPDGVSSIWCYTTDSGSRWEYCDPIITAAYGDWGSEGCSVTCGTGVETFNRECIGVGECTGDATKTEACTLEACEIVYPGGWGGKDCVLPFTYKGVEYTECTTYKSYKSPWCSHDAVYDGDWGYCTEDPNSNPYPGMGHDDCVFPFEYKGVTYNQCTRTNNHAEPWCSTDVKYSGGWRKCIAAAAYGDWVSEGCSVTCGTGVETFNRECSGYGECTGDATKTEACNLDACETCQEGNEKLTGDGADYRGCQSVTRSGKTCQAWNSQEPHSHSRTPENYPDSGLVGNYCRNPDGVSSIWCYTTDSGSRWEYCDPIIIPEVVEPEVPEVVEPEVPEVVVEPEVPVVTKPKKPKVKRPRRVKFAQAVEACGEAGFVEFATEAEYNNIVNFIFDNSLPRGRYWTAMEVKPYGDNKITLSTGATGNFAKWTKRASLKMSKPRGWTKKHVVIDAVATKAATGMINIYAGAPAYVLCAGEDNKMYIGVYR